MADVKPVAATSPPVVQLIVSDVSPAIAITCAGAWPLIQMKSPTTNVFVNVVLTPVTVAVFAAIDTVCPAGAGVDEMVAFGSKNSKIWNGLMWMWNGCEI